MSLETGTKRKGDENQARPRKRTKSTKDQDDVRTGSDVAALEQQIQDSQRHFNNIATLLQLSRREIKLSKQSLSATLALCRVFCRFLADGRLSRSTSASSKEQTVTEWLRERYAEYKTLLLRLLGEGGDSQQEIALTLMMQLVREEGINSTTASEGLSKGHSLDTSLTLMLSNPRCISVCNFMVDRYAQTFDDIRHAIFTKVANLLMDDSSDDAVNNCFSVISRLDALQGAELTSFYIQPLDGKTGRKALSYTTHRKQAQKAWLAMLSQELNKEQRKQVLGFMTYRVVPWIQNVEVLMDFLSDSFDTGGATSLLALSGLFYLMQQKNLDYPDFYTKLYSLLDDDLLYSKHRSRFFRLLDTFLASTHLPAAMVASFVKKLSRLSLHAPPAGIVAVVPWVYNMLKTHPTCTFMVHRECRTEEERQEIEEHGAADDFDAKEKNPMQTHAIDSCLWELETLQSHYHPNVASLAKIMSEQFTKSSYNLEDFLDHSYASLVESELGRELKKTPVVEFEIPKTIFAHADGDATLQTLMETMLHRQQ